MFYDSFLFLVDLVKCAHPIATVDLLGGAQRVPLLGLYGLYSHPPKHSWVFTMCDSADNTFYGMADDIENRPEDLLEGDVILYNTLTKDYIHIKQDKSINIATSGMLNVSAAAAINVTCLGPVAVTAPTVTLSAQCAIGGAGGAAIARVGDAVEVHVGGGSSSGTWSGTITSGGSNTAT